MDVPDDFCSRRASQKMIRERIRSARRGRGSCATATLSRDSPHGRSSPAREGCASNVGGRAFYTLTATRSGPCAHLRAVPLLPAVGLALRKRRAVDRTAKYDSPPGGPMALDRSQTLFLIDDDDDLRFTVGLSLRDAGFEVSEFPSADEALAAVETTVPAAIFLDNRIEGMTAPDFVDALRAKGFDELPVVLLTGSQNIGEIAAQMKVFDALPKPFDIDDLIARAKTASAANR
jgi:CheY-like chemotaxis protein